ncbi:tRNA-specific adenosine deaminase [Cysteiniphilum litorale]|uniref:tRNA-specific adenosine deaminase n=2 Tax=Fastidiosibacteraceae TaxID=2056687 RepID=A0A8J2Z5C2_9GAMM|nr:tRNA-specific adenosine deaminase [Cysteiniphilum litorale]
MSLMTKEQWMAYALLEAKKAQEHNEVPVGAIIVKDNQIIGRGFNQMIMNNDPTAHAEIIALRGAAQMMQNYRLPECDLYVTLEPCMMCLGAMVHARIRTLYFATKEPKAGVACSKAQLHTEPFLNHYLNVEGGILADDASDMLKAFFNERRLQKKHSN